MEVGKIITENLNYYMSIQDISKTDLSKKMNVSPMSITYWTSGKTFPNIERWDDLCRVLRISPSTLVTERDGMYHVRLFDHEKNLLDMYNQLNHDGKQKADEYLAMLIKTGDYEKGVSLSKKIPS